jgi:hypothetical protein
VWLFEILTAGEVENFDTGFGNLAAKPVTKF